MSDFSRKRLVIAGLILVLVGIAAFAIYFFFFRNITPQGSSESAKFSKFWTERIDAAMVDKNCPDSKQPTIPTNSYQGKLHDGHIHIATIFTGGPNDQPGYEDREVNSTLGLNLTMSELACVFKHDGTSRVFAFFPVYREMIGQHTEIVKQTMKKYPDIFIPFNMPPDNDGSPTGYPTVDYKTLETMLTVYPNMFEGYGEIGLYARSGGAPELPPDSKRLLDIYPVVRKNKLAVYFHLGEGQREAYKKVIKANPDINFVFHGDQLITQSQDGNSQDLSQIEDILASAPNVYYEVDELWGDVWLLRPQVTKEQFLAHLKDYEPLLQKDLATWKGFIERFPDQVIWGSDRGVTRWTVDLEVGRQLTDYVRAFIARLDSSVQEKYAYKNLEKIIDD